MGLNGHMKKELCACIICHRLLTNKKSIKLHAGPVCIKKLADEQLSFQLTTAAPKIEPKTESENCELR
jgi:hypothetical protein